MNSRGNSKRVSESKRLATCRMCPISPNIPTRMTKDGFIRACKRIRSGGKLETNSDIWACPKCPTGKHIDEGAFFVSPSSNITFVSLADFDRDGNILENMIKKIKLRREIGTWPLLTPEIARFIRGWHKQRPDVSQRKMADIFGISRRHVGRIIHGQRWKE